MRSVIRSAGILKVLTILTMAAGWTVYASAGDQSPAAPVENLDAWAAAGEPLAQGPGADWPGPAAHPFLERPRWAERMRGPQAQQPVPPGGDPRMERPSGTRRWLAQDRPPPAGPQGALRERLGPLMQQQLQKRAMRGQLGLVGDFKRVIVDPLEATMMAVHGIVQMSGDNPREGVERLASLLDRQESLPARTAIRLGLKELHVKAGNKAEAMEQLQAIVNENGRAMAAAEREGRVGPRPEPPRGEPDRGPRPPEDRGRRSGPPEEPLRP